MTEPVLSVRNLNIDYVGAEGEFHAVKSVSFDIAPGEFFGLAGESGCGKSTIAFAISRLHRPPALIRTGSQILVGGRDVMELDDAELRRFRWREVAMVFQSAMNSLNPVLTIEAQFHDVLKAHGRGLAFGLDRLAFAERDGRLALVAADAGLGDVARWRLREFVPHAGYRAALAWRPSLE